MNQFRKHLKKQAPKKLDEATLGNSKTHLRNTNKFLDQAGVALETAIGHLEDYIEVATDNEELSPQERREALASIDRLESLLNQLEKAGDKIPAV